MRNCFIALWEYSLDLSLIRGFSYIPPWHDLHKYSLILPNSTLLKASFMSKKGEHFNSWETKHFWADIFQDVWSMSKSTLLASSMSQSMERLLVSAKVPSSSPPTWSKHCRNPRILVLFAFQGQIEITHWDAYFSATVSLPLTRKITSKTIVTSLLNLEKEHFEAFLKRLDCWTIWKCYFYLWNRKCFHASSVHSKPGGDFSGANRGVSSG